MTGHRAIEFAGFRGTSTWNGQEEVGNGAGVIMGGEATHTSKEPAQGKADGQGIGMLPVGLLVFSEKPDGDGNTGHKSAIAGQTMPDLEDIQVQGAKAATGDGFEVVCEAEGLVEDQMAEVASHKGAQNQPADQLVDKFGVYAKTCCFTLCKVATKQEAQSHQNPEHMNGQVSEEGDREGFKTGNEGRHGQGL